jgi:hypothetical protein
LTIVSLASFAQTNVSGGIFANTTWTLANSPYIVVDNVVVFPGYTLTIEPGVVVKFDSTKYLEIRQGTLIANGTAVDSITFTSNSITPTPGIWGGSDGIFLNGALGGSCFNFCNVEYSTKGLNGASNILYVKNSTFINNQYGASIGGTPVDSCVFKFNTDGLSGFGTATINSCTISNNVFAIEDVADAVIQNCIIDSNQTAFGGVSGTGVRNVHFYNCNISYNQTGINVNIGGVNAIRNCVLDYNTYHAMGFGFNGSDSVTNCEIKYNATGISVQTGSLLITHCDIENNGIGLAMFSTNPSIYCNKICNSTSYDLQSHITSSIYVPNNYWCTSDSISTEAVIYDAYDDATVGLVYFMPLDTTCYIATGINEIAQENLPFSIFPNPTNDYLTVHIAGHVAQSQIRIINLLGEIKYSSPATGAETNLNISSLAGGIYFVEVVSGNKVTRERFIKQ